MIVDTSKSVTRLRVGHLFNEFCPKGSTLRYWPVINPHVQSSVYCLRRTNANVFPHEDLYVESLASSARALHGVPGRRILASALHRMSWSRYLKAARPEVIHVQYGTKAVRFLPMLERAARPFVVSFRGSDINCASYDRKYVAGLYKLFESASFCHFVSEDLRCKGIRLGCPAEKAKALYCGAPTRDAIASYSKRKNECEYYCVASLLPCKGHETLFHAFAAVKQEQPQAKLNLIGSGPLLDRLSWLASDLNLSSDIVFHGQLMHEEVQTRLAERADVVVLASQKDDGGHEEGLPTCLQEASALGIACVATRCGGIPELILDNETGFVVAQRDIVSLATAMLKLGLDPDMRQQFGMAARERASRHFNLENFYRNITEVYLQAAGGSHAHATT